MPTEQFICDMSKEILKDMRIVESRITHLEKKMAETKTQVAIFVILLELTLPYVKSFLESFH